MIPNLSAIAIAIVPVFLLLSACTTVRVNGIDRMGQCVMDQRPVKAVQQETGSTCWAASAQVIGDFHGLAMPQCEILNRTHARNNPVCCHDASASECQGNGWPHDAFHAMGLRYQVVRGPLTPRQIVAQLCRNGPFISVVRYPHSLGGGVHTVVVTGYRIQGNTMRVQIDAHDSRGIQDVSYHNYLAGDQHRIDRNYVAFHR